MNESVLTRIEGHVAWVTLHRPHALNAINDEVRAALPAAIDAAQNNPEVRVIVLQGAGEKAFCVGADIKEFTRLDDVNSYRQERVHDHWVHAFDRATKPIVALIHGYCLGGGLEIALACDIRVAASDAVFGFPETGHGVMPAAGGSQRVTRVLGLGLAMDLVLTGQRMNAATALATGLVSRVVDRAALDEEGRALAEGIAAKPPLAIQYSKEALKAGTDLPLALGMRHEIDLYTHLINTEDRLEAAQAFREKRKPRFTGR